MSAYIERWNLVLGVIFILIISFMPEGLVPGSVRLWRAGGGLSAASRRASAREAEAPAMSALHCQGCANRSEACASRPRSTLRWNPVSDG